jgi:hypothetical protein
LIRPTGRIYISHDFFFDEHVFPFASLNSNSYSRLCDEIVLIPIQTPPMLSPNEVANIDDYMFLPIILVVTNDPQPSVENVMHIALLMENT